MLAASVNTVEMPPPNCPRSSLTDPCPSSKRLIAHCLFSISLLTRPLCIAAHNFDFLGLDIALVIKLEVDILNEESPDFVAESISIQVALQTYGNQLHFTIQVLLVVLP